MKKEVATYVVDTLVNSLGEMNKLLFDIKDSVDENEYKKIHRTVARVMNTVHSEITMDIVKEHPDLSLDKRQPLNKE